MAQWVLVERTIDPANTTFDVGITNDTESPEIGFNTTPGGADFFRFATQRTPFNVETVATATFSFDVPIQAFGAYITGLDDGSELSLILSDGTSQTLPIEGVESLFQPSTAQFFGFTDPGKSISSIMVQNGYLGLPAPADDPDAQSLLPYWH